ncbi:MAG: 1-deoxy-D-xylulose-5-phosphate reductoisomerase [Candidatus Hydrogenedentes bacterium]|nr:1-deoxy-D-xylulose-5-phosphate reductoisomerase [Candidatus Hydrogenedentota bacterium]
MPGPPKNITILGSTGSIGRSALDVVRHYPGQFNVVGLAAGRNTELLAEQIREFRPRYAAMSDPDAARALAAMDLGVTIIDAPSPLDELARIPADTVLCAMVGAVGLPPLLAAIDAGNRVAVANKEPFVMAGKLVMERAAARGVAVLPVDSEHNAIFQCTMGHAHGDIRCIHLTASGGPFYRRDRASLADVKPAEATRHPTWDMGAKISVDSATLMNKGLEIVEAMWLFDLAPDQIDVVIHPQSIIHSLVEFKDGNILAHLGVTDMRFPILFALTHPERVELPMERLKLTALKALTFDAPDFSAFPCLAYARNAAAAGGTAPAILNAANEVAVEAFCGHRLGFLDISEVVGRVYTGSTIHQDYSLDAVLAADAEARARACEAVKQLGH